MKLYENKQKKGTLKIQKSQIMILVLNRSPISADFPIVRFIGDQKTALPGESQVYIQNNYTSKTNTLFKKDVAPGENFNN